MRINCILWCPQGRSIGMCIFLFGLTTRAMLKHCLFAMKYVVLSFAYKKGWVRKGSCYLLPSLHSSSIVAFGISLYLLYFQHFQQWITLSELPTCVEIATKSVCGLLLGMKARAMNQSKVPSGTAWIVFDRTQI